MTKTELHDAVSKLYGEIFANRLIEAMDSGRTIIVNGTSRSGKTTFVKMIRECGGKALENFEVSEFYIRRKDNEDIRNEETTV